jgi:hypothetical protein
MKRRVLFFFSMVGLTPLGTYSLCYSSKYDDNNAHFILHSIQNKTNALLSYKLIEKCLFWLHGFVVNVPLDTHNAFNALI